MTKSTGTLTLSDFLLARIAEDEEIARLAVDAELVFATRNGQKATPPSDLGGHWLADCGARRQIVDQAIDAKRAADRWTPERLAVDTRSPLPEYARTDAYAEVLRFLALPYADHPEYREEWRP